jgi:hypothetical protein
LDAAKIALSMQAIISANPITVTVKRATKQTDSAGSEFFGPFEAVGSFVGRLYTAKAGPQAVDNEGTMSQRFSYNLLAMGSADINAGDRATINQAEYDVAGVYPTIINGIKTHANISLKVLV